MANPLREAIKRYFYPYAESQGFKRAKSSHPQFTSFRRFQGERIHVFDVQWDKYGRPRFIVNFGEANVNNVGVPKMEVETQHCNHMYRLQRKKGGSYSCWFQLRKPWLEALSSRRLKYQPEEVVDQLIAYFLEMEAWWSDKLEGPHVQRLRRVG
ncbi:DUF4304 domain-containing protein [Duganella sp. Root1480D1]|uniref:DUF4304 domain-containing protein n=1 Tax=Duganella sp. Root1480D1 TaxID=1736471 RepID=UPI00070FE928|nr:hypothetical protein ASD58_06715 [Duganella sp. Root1480D1]